MTISDASFCDVGTGNTHRYTYTCLFYSRGIIHPIASHSDNSSQFLPCLYNPDLVFGRNSGIYCYLRHFFF